MFIMKPFLLLHPYYNDAQRSRPVSSSTSSSISAILSHTELDSEIGEPERWSQSDGGSDSELEIFEFSELESVEELWLQYAWSICIRLAVTSR